MSYLFIPREKWEAFACNLTDGQYICKNSKAMYHEIKTKGKNDAHALALLTLELCKIADGEVVWSNFILSNMDSDIDKDQYDIPNNDWKSKS